MIQIQPKPAPQQHLQHLQHPHYLQQNPPIPSNYIQQNSPPIPNNLSLNNTHTISNKANPDAYPIIPNSSANTNHLSHDEKTLIAIADPLIPDNTIPTANNIFSSVFVNKCFMFGI